MVLKEEATGKLEVLEERYRYPKLKRSEFNEQDTITKFIMPLLEVLGWDIYDISEVKQEVGINETKKLTL